MILPKTPFSIEPENDRLRSAQSLPSGVPATSHYLLATVKLGAAFAVPLIKTWVPMVAGIWALIALFDSRHILKEAYYGGIFGLTVAGWLGVVYASSALLTTDLEFANTHDERRRAWTRNIAIGSFLSGVTYCLMSIVARALRGLWAYQWNWTDTPATALKNFALAAVIGGVVLAQRSYRPQERA